MKSLSSEISRAISTDAAVPASPAAVLTAKLVREIFPIAYSDRRSNKDLFVSVVAEEHLRSDDRFYDGLLRLLVSGPVGTLREYDRRMLRDKVPRKTFRSRASRWLFNKSSGNFDIRGKKVNPPDLFSPSSPEQAIRELLERLIGDDPPVWSRDDAPAENGEAVSVTSTEMVTLESWEAIARSISEALEALNSPDLQAARRIFELAERLIPACELASAEGAKREILRARAETLRGRISKFSLELSEELCVDTVSDSAFLDAVESCVAAVETSRIELQTEEQARAAAYDAVKAAATNQDSAKIIDLSAVLKSQDERIQILNRSAEDCLFKLSLMFEAAGQGKIGLKPQAEILQSPEAEPATTAIQTDELPAERVLMDRSKVGAGLQDIAPIATQPESSLDISLPAFDASASAVDDKSAEAFAVDQTLVTIQSLEAESDDASTSRQDLAFLGSAHAHAADDCLEPKLAGNLESAASDFNVALWDNSAESQESPDELVAHYLNRGERVLAWHAARLHEEVGGVAAPVLKALAILPAIQKAEDLADPICNEALAGMMDAMPKGHDQVASARLVLAALLRPALFDPDFGARAFLGALRERPATAAYAELVGALSELGYEVRLSVSLITEIAGSRVMESLPSATRRLKAWLDEARHRKTFHQPTYMLFHIELRSDHEIGRIFEAAISGSADADSLAEGLITKLNHNRAAQQAFVAAAEQAYGRPARDRIEGGPLNWFCNALQEACDVLAAWREARQSDASRVQDQRRDKLLRALGPIRNALDSIVLGPDVEGSALARAAGEALVQAITDLRALIEGRLETGQRMDLRRLRRDPLLRLPGGCQDWSDGEGDAFAEEREASERRLRVVLARPESISSDDLAALDHRLAEGALLAAHHLLRRLTDSGTCSREQVNEYRQRLDEAIASEQMVARERVSRLRQSLTMIGYLDLDAATSLPGDLARLGDIDAALRAPLDGDSVAIPAINGIRRPDVPPDFPELRSLLADLDSRRDSLEARIRTRQRADLERLVQGPAGESARALLADLERHDPVTIDDAIAEISANREVPLAEIEAPDLFDRFFPSFVRELEHAVEETRRGPVLSALRERRSAGPLDFTEVHLGKASRLKLMIESWATAENALVASREGQLRSSLLQFLEQIGFTSCRLTDHRVINSQRLHQVTLDCDIPRATDWFLPPAFGSASGGRFMLALAHVNVQLDQIFGVIGREAPDAAWIVLSFARLNVQDRSRLAVLSRKYARSVLVLDEVLMFFSALHGEDPLANFITCAMPFSWVQPYTTTPGQIPPEMFFGRRAEIDSIVSREEGGCLIYGGRQLGKSVLLNHIRAERHRPDRGELALYLDIKPIGGPGSDSSMIWVELAHQLRKYPGLEKAPDAAVALVTLLETWLEREPARRMLAMFDEADNFLRAEHAAGYPNLLRLKSLMERTGRRFKAIFAGLHNVRRTAQAPNSPLPHLGTPICIGPMNMSPDNRLALRRLATVPMHAAGLEYAAPELSSEILARINYYPSLVQVYGEQIVKNVSRRPPVGGSGPRWRLDRERLFEGVAADRIAEQIRDRFQLTLNLDIRYDCIARAIALHRLELAYADTQVFAKGIPSNDLWDFVRDFWPKHRSEPGIDHFEELLREMKDLGVLAEFPGNRFGLRNAQVAQMLGTRDELYTALDRLESREEEPAYDAAEFFRLLRPELPDQRAPLADRDLDRLFDCQRTGLRVLVAPQLLAGDDVPGRLLAAARIWLPQGSDCARATADGLDLGRKLDQLKSDVSVLLIEDRWSSAIAGKLVQLPKVRSGQVLPIWWLEHVPEELGDVMLFHAATWPEGMLRHWLLDHNLAPAMDDARTRGAIMEASGGSPARLQAMSGILTDLVTRPVDERVNELAKWHHGNRLPAGILGIDADDKALLSCIREEACDGFLIQDLVELCPLATDSRVERLLKLGLLRHARNPAHWPSLTPLGRLFLK